MRKDLENNEDRKEFERLEEGRESKQLVKGGGGRWVERRQ